MRTGVLREAMLISQYCSERLSKDLLVYLSPLSPQLWVPRFPAPTLQGYQLCTLK